MAVPVRSGGDQLVVEVVANERHEHAAGRMNAANRQPRGNLGDSCNWPAAFKARLACSFLNGAPFGLPRLSMPNKTSGPRGDCRILRGSHDDRLLGIKKGPGQGPWVSWVTAHPAAA